MSVATLERPTPTITKGWTPTVPMKVQSPEPKAIEDFPLAPIRTETPILDNFVGERIVNGDNPWPSTTGIAQESQRIDREIHDTFESVRGMVDDFSAWIDELYPERIQQRELEKFTDQYGPLEPCAEVPNSWDGQPAVYIDPVNGAAMCRRCQLPVSEHGNGVMPLDEEIDRGVQEFFDMEQEGFLGSDVLGIDPSNTRTGTSITIQHQGRHILAKMYRERVEAGKWKRLRRRVKWEFEEFWSDIKQRVKPPKREARHGQDHK